MYVLLCVVGDNGGAAADDDCAVAGGDGVCCCVADRCVGDGVDVECVGGVGVADVVGYVVVDVR